MPDAKRLRVLIVEDEPLGIDRIVELLDEQPDVEVVGTAQNGDAAIEAIRSLRPDLVFLDVQMPRKSGLDVVREIGAAEMPVTVFVTGFDRYALQAFEFAAVDYIVKPYSDERFETAFTRARQRAELQGMKSLRDQLLLLLQSGDALSQQTAPKYLDRIGVPMRGRMLTFPVEDIDYITASGVYAEIAVGKERYLIRESLQALEEQLDPKAFMRIHRSEIVRLDRVQMMVRSGADHEVELKNGVRLRVSRSRREALEQRLGRV
ncbi:MAG: LytTR family DNA-binding domain-containing protein [Gemmatimonadota bacterium]